MYDMPKTVDDRSCQMIAKIAPLLSDFGFCFRNKFTLLTADDFDSVFHDHRKFLKQLCHSILLLSLDKHPYYSIEDKGCGLTMWI